MASKKVKGKMRVTQKRGRTNSGGGVYSAKHNDRNFDISAAPHINPEYSKDNWYWYYHQDKYPGLTFEELEKRFYENTFSSHLDERNEFYKNNYQPKYIKTMDEYRTSPKSCPEEVIEQIGNYRNTVNAVTLQRICLEQIRWEQKTFPQVQILDVALHVDEPVEDPTPHLHKRLVWVAHDKNGNFMVSQAAALKEMGIERPNLNEPEGVYNNAKMVYTEMCRNHFVELCKEHGLNIEEQPRETSRSKIPFMVHKAGMIKKELVELEQLKEEIMKDPGIEREYEYKQAQAEISRLEEENKIIKDIIEESEMNFPGYSDYFFAELERRTKEKEKEKDKER